MIERTVSDSERIWILIFSIFSGLMMLFLLGFISSFITSDDYYAHQTKSLFGDGRFVSGVVYWLFQGAFANDVSFRQITNFFMGASGFLFLNQIAKFSNIEEKYTYYYAVVALAGFCSAEILFFYDIISLYYIISFPFLIAFFSSFKRCIDGDKSSDLVFIFFVSFVCNAFIFSTYQVISYFMFILILSFFVLSDGKRSIRVLYSAAASLAGMVSSAAAIGFFTKLDVYSEIFGYGLRGRAGSYIFSERGILEVAKDYALSVEKLQIFQYNSIGMHGFIIVFIIFSGIKRKSIFSNMIFLSKLSILICCIYASPFLLIPDASTNARIFGSLYAYGYASYLLIALYLVSVDRESFLLSIRDSIALSVLFLILFALILLGNSYAQNVARNEIYVAVLLCLVIFVSLYVSVGASSKIILCGVVLAFLSVELQKSMNTTERWKSDAVFDRIIVDKLTEAVLDNYYRYGFKSLQIEYGIRPETLTGASIRSYHYSAAEFWKNSVQSLGYRMNFKRNDALCSEQGDYGVFKVIESSPNTLKFCI